MACLGLSRQPPSDNARKWRLRARYYQNQLALDPGVAPWQSATEVVQDLKVRLAPCVATFLRSTGMH
ncbi:hypothetical protein M404DRAFT_996421 [Pisolithus tinctorius Marx 270]|uniref:Uncharacterized protein n=1 Tax=Pisolithus tinctorius Marx 270 TaxID=870435 RepID=A0A0C3JKC2_PISTI|nr:hypothetical protein M404DRAFT_996421 [Pisolithus tinctorius Marx 270]